VKDQNAAQSKFEQRPRFWGGVQWLMIGSGIVVASLVAPSLTNGHLKALFSAGVMSGGVIAILATALIVSDLMRPRQQ
jgi:hypothetical protein